MSALAAASTITSSHQPIATRVADASNLPRPISLVVAQYAITGFQIEDFYPPNNRMKTRALLNNLKRWPQPKSKDDKVQDYLSVLRYLIEDLAKEPFSPCLRIVIATNTLGLQAVMVYAQYK